MPFAPKTPKSKSPAELATERVRADELLAIALDLDPDSDGLEPSNLTVVESHIPIHQSVHTYRQKSIHSKAQAAATKAQSSLIESLRAKL